MQAGVTVINWIQSLVSGLLESHCSVIGGGHRRTTMGIEVHTKRHVLARYRFSILFALLT